MDGTTFASARCDSNALSIVGAATQGTFTLWHYDSPHTLGCVLSPGYFEGARLLGMGDMICVSAGDNGAQLYVASVSPVRVRVMAS